ncbi:MAG: phage holin family protein [Bacteroidales bacterium]|nr:phage holin family protein [Bacteroidales bacterium]
MEKNDYAFKFASVGGSVRVKITSGEDIAHLGELDRKMWTVLSCPASGLEFDAKTLGILDSNKDGKIRVDEVIAAAQYLTKIIKDPDLIVKGETTLPLSAFNEEDEDGRRLLASAKQILSNLGLDKDSIDLSDTADSTKIFAGTKFNGDGVITPASTDDEVLSALITTIAANIGKATDRSGEDGITADIIEQFYASCADYKAWCDAAEAGKAEIFPFGDDTEAALAATDAIKDKVADYFMRCKLIGFDEAASGVLDVSVDKIGAISGGDLSKSADEIATYPIARPSKEAVLPLVEGLNPAWKGAVSAFRTLVCADKETLTEDEWNEIVSKFGPYTAWKDAKKGSEVEPLGLEQVTQALSEDRKGDLLKLVEEDKALESESLSIDEVGNLLSLYSHFYDFLNNYVVLSDFYDPDKKAMFQAGRLYIDQRSTDLCIKVDGPAPEISSLSGMYILYCACNSEKLGKSFNIAAVLTDGDVDGLRVGKNAVFYDREGNDYTAKVTAIVDNPISVRQAFWSPYKKVARMVNDRIDKKAAEKNEKSMSGLTAATNNAADGKAPAVPFDIGKFAGIFAAIGMALGLVGAALAGIVAALKGITFWQVLLIIAVVMLLISGPSMFIAWRKLRKRDLGPVLNANGWAVNAASYVNVKFGRTLTSLVKFPKMTAVDPEARKKASRKRFWTWLIVILILACAGFLGYRNYTQNGGIFKFKPDPVVEETVAEPAEEGEAPAAELPAADAPAEEAAPVE